MAQNMLVSILFIITSKLLSTQKENNLYLDQMKFLISFPHSIF